MNINRKVFYDAVRASLFNKMLSQPQVDGMNIILDEWEEEQLTDLRWLAYMLGTVKWETGSTMQPIEEWGKGEGHTYGLEDPDAHQCYYGRGFVQLTWKFNYAKMGALLGIDLVHHPELALDERNACLILFEGMLRRSSGVGDFTNHSLEEFFNDEKEDWIHARTIINGMDHAGDIAAIAHKFYTALMEATCVS